MYQEKPFGLCLKYALPQMIGLLLNSVYLIVDGIFIGNRLGREAMAAAAISVPVVEILIAIALLISSGAGIIISGMFGNGEPHKANRMFNLAVGILAMAGMFIAVLGNVCLNSLAALLGATPDIHGQAVSYLWYIVTFSPFLMFSFLLSSLVRNDNRPKLAMVALGVGSVSNIMLDYVFLYPLDMGIAGAALATALGPIFSVMILLPHFLRRKGQLYFTRPVKSLQGIRRIFLLGVPEFIMEFSIGIVTFLYNYAIVKNGYGELGLAAYLIIGYMMLIILTLFLGMVQGLQPIFSYYRGAGEAARSRALLAYVAKLILGIGICAYLLVLAFAGEFAAVFAPGDPELVAFTGRTAVGYFWGFLFAGCNILLISYWQAVHRTRAALVVALLRSVIILPLLTVLLPLLWGGQVIWLCHSVAEVLSAGGALGILLRHRRQDRKEAPQAALPVAKQGL